MVTIKQRLTKLERMESDRIMPEVTAIVFLPIEETEHSEILEHEAAGRRVILTRVVDGRLDAPNLESLPETVSLAIGD